jgi:hypothetical protein|tara:strand:- start:1448 stop:1702 length:255 start_codon:yes stop_codon:yes gene_type:complete
MNDTPVTKLEVYGQKLLISIVKTDEGTHKAKVAYTEDTQDEMIPYINNYLISEGFKEQFDKIIECLDNEDYEMDEVRMIANKLK